MFYPKFDFLPCILLNRCRKDKRKPNGCLHEVIPVVPHRSPPHLAVQWAGLFAHGSFFGERGGTERPKRAPLGAAAGAGQWATPLPPGWARRSDRTQLVVFMLTKTEQKMGNATWESAGKKNIKVLIENDAGISASESVELVESVG